MSEIAILGFYPASCDAVSDRAARTVYSASPMTMSAVVTTYLFYLGCLGITAAFSTIRHDCGLLGMHLFTDPATSPRTSRSHHVRRALRSQHGRPTGYLALGVPTSTTSSFRCRSEPRSLIDRGALERAPRLFDPAARSVSGTSPAAPGLSRFGNRVHFDDGAGRGRPPSRPVAAVWQRACAEHGRVPVAIFRHGGQAL